MSRPASRSISSLAKELGRETQLASLELALEGRDLAGSCDIGFSCAYTNTISWRGATTPLPMENDPRVVFERLFGDRGSTDRAARLARIAADRSILDSVTRPHRRPAAGGSARAIAPSSREYLEAVRDVERRIQKAEEQSGQQLPLVQQPAGIPASFEDHAKLMFDLQVLAYQTDLTRVITFMLGRELSGRTFPEIGVPSRTTRPRIIRTIRRSSRISPRSTSFHSTLFAYYLDKLQADAGRRRLAARSHDDRLRRRHGRLQPARHRPICRSCSSAAASGASLAAGT